MVSRCSLGIENHANLFIVNRRPQFQILKGLALICLMSKCGCADAIERKPGIDLTYLHQEIGGMIGRQSWIKELLI